MAQRDVDTKTGLSAPNLGAASFVRQGVVDKSGLLEGQGQAAALGVTATAKRTEAVALENLSKVIPGVVDTGLEIHKGVALANLQQEQNQEIDAFLQARKDPNLARTSAENAASLDLASHSLWDKLGKGEATIGDLDANLEAFDKETQALQAANQQGIVQPSELQTRLLAITRKHINANPGLSNELLNHAEKILALSGVSSLRDTKQKLDDSAAKAFEQQKNFLQKEASKHNIEFDVFQMDNPDYLGEIQDKVNQRKRDLNTFTNINEDEKVRNIKTTQQSDDFFRTKGSGLLRGALTAFNLDATQILQANKDNPEAAMQQVNDLVDQYMVEAQENLGPVASLSSGDGKFHLDTLKSTLEGVVTRLGNAATGKARLEVLTTQHGITEKLQEMQIQGVVNVPALKIIASNDGLLSWVRRNPHIEDKLIHGFSSIMTGDSRNPLVAEMMKSSTNTPGVKDAVGVSKALLEAGRSEEFMKSVRVFKDVSQSGQMSNDDMFHFMDSFMDSFSQRFVGEQARKAGTSEAITDVFAMAGQYTEYLGTALQNKTQGKDVRAIEVPGVGIRYVAKGDPKLESELNEKYAKRVNMMVKTFANIGGWTNDQAWQQIKGAYSELLKVDGSGAGSTTSGTVSPNVTDKIIGVESGGKSDAKNPNSTATGLGQFIEGTWLEEIKNSFPNLIQGKSKQEILDLRKDPEISRQVLDKHTQRNGDALRSASLPVNDTTLYLAHFLGVGAASKVLKSSPDTPISSVLGQDAINANKSILGGDKTVAHVIKFAERKMS